jgi:hypothetical protein
MARKVKIEDREYESYFEKAYINELGHEVYSSFWEPNFKGLWAMHVEKEVYGPKARFRKRDPDYRPRK